MPESKTRKEADVPRKQKAAGATKQRRAKASGSRRLEPSTSRRVKAPSSRRWVPPTFITVGLLGVAWLVLYYIAGPNIPYMQDLGNWNILIGMGGMAAAFGISTLWK